MESLRSAFIATRNYIEERPGDDSDVCLKQSAYPVKSYGTCNLTMPKLDSTPVHDMGKTSVVAAAVGRAVLGFRNKAA